jgi:hypothetical protein
MHMNAYGKKLHHFRGKTTRNPDGDVVTHFDLGPHRSVRDLLADPRHFHLVFMQAANHFHDRVLPATCLIQRMVINRRARRMYNN